MIFLGNDTECTELLAQINADLGYPRGYTEADVGVLVFRRGSGPWAPIESIRTESAAAVVAVDVDAEGTPTSQRRKLGFVSLDAGRRNRVGRARVLRLLNRAPKSRLVLIPTIGPTRADEIIAYRVNGRMIDIEDAQGIGLPALSMQAIRDYVADMLADEDEETA